MRHAQALFLGLFTLSFLGGCFTPQPVLRVTPRAPMDRVVWAGGVPIMSVTGERSRVAAAFAREEGASLAFRVEVQNLGNKTLLLDSSHFSYRICRRTIGRLEACGTHTRVRDPEAEILALDLQRSRDQASNANDMAFFTVLSIINAAGTVAGVASGNHQAANHAAHSLDRSVAWAKHAEAAEDTQRATYAMSRALWETTAFRKTTTPPGMPVAGMVFVDRDEQASGVMLYATIDGERYTFPFNQTLISASRRR